MYANYDSLTDQFFTIWEDSDNEQSNNNPDDDYSGDDEFYREFYGD